LPALFAAKSDGSRHLPSVPFQNRTLAVKLAQLCDIVKGSPRAANLKFLSVSLQGRYRNFKFKAALESYIFQSSFDSEVRIGGCRDIMRTSESEL
jgi:hypothetical protein